MRPGYKRTEVGVIPEDWKIARLAAVCDVRDGTHESPEYYDQGVTFVTSKNIIEGRLDLDNVNYISHEDAVSINQRSRVRRGDILMSMIGTIGNSVLVDFEPDFCIKNVALIKPRNLNARYLIQLLNSPMFQEYLGENLEGGIQKFVALGTLRKLAIPLPPLPEQRAIAEALSGVDALIAALERLIAKKRAIKQGAMQQLLTGQTRLPGFSGPWDVKQWGEVIVHCSSGAAPYRGRPDFFKGQIKWITSSELNYDVIIDTKEHVSEEAVEKTNLKIHPTGTFLMAITGLEAAGTRGACGIVGSPATTNQSCMAIYPTPELLTEYLYHYYVYRGNELALKYCQGTKQQSYTAKLVQILPIDLPPTTEEQRAIAAVLSDMEAEIAVLEARREKTRALKQGMMQELLTGRIRLMP